MSSRDDADMQVMGFRSHDDVTQYDRESSMNQPKAAPGPASAQDEMRAAFEVALIEDCKPLANADLVRINSGSYNSTWTQSNWEFFQNGAQWQATRQAATEPCCGEPAQCGKACVERGRYLERQSSPFAPSDLHAALLELPLPNADIDGYCGEAAYSRGCMENFRHTIAELVSNATPVPTKSSVDELRDMLRVEVDRLIAVQTAVAVPERIKMAGAKMANTMFNLAQGDLGTVAARALFKEMQVEWDAAIRAAHPQEPKP